MKDKKSFIIFILIGMILIVSVPTAAMIFNDVIGTKFNISLLPKNYVKNIILNINTYKSFMKFNNPINAFGWVCILWYVLAYIIGKCGVFKIQPKFEQSEEYGSHGTSRWLTKKEIEKDYYNNNQQGWFLGSETENLNYTIGMDAAYHTVDNKTKLNMQAIVIGPPGSDKTTGFILPVIFNIANAYKNNEIEKADLIITDPKPELYPLTSDYLRKMGYDVFALDFIDLANGDCLNPLDFINDDKTLMEIAQGYVDSVSNANSEGGNSGDQAFWNNQEGQVLAALMGFIKQVYPKEKQNFTELAKILVSEEVSDIDNAKEFFINNGVTGAALQLWNNFLMLAESERTRANILGGLAEKLKLFAITGVQNITHKTTIDITKIGEKKEKPMAVFICMPIEKTFSPIINVVVTTILKQLYKTARKTRNRLPFPVYFLLEEMANIGKIPGMKEMLGTMRGPRIYPMMVWQSLSQMKDRYGDKGFEDIMSMCDTHVYLGINDEFTSEYCSKALGDTTIKIQGISQQADDGILTINKKSESQNYQNRKLLLSDECRKLDNKKLIVIQRAKQPMKLYKVQYKYWEYSLSKIKELSDLKEIAEHETKKEDETKVINITSKIDKETIINDERENYDKKEDSNNLVKNEEEENYLESAKIDVKALNMLKDKEDDFDLEI